MANGLYCSESLPVTPKFRHDSNGENNPPMGNGTKTGDRVPTSGGLILMEQNSGAIATTFINNNSINQDELAKAGAENTGFTDLLMCKETMEDLSQVVPPTPDNHGHAPDGGQRGAGVGDGEAGRGGGHPGPVKGGAKGCESFGHSAVRADCDQILLRDDRVLQNLLRNEERYLPSHPDYFSVVQVEVKSHMRKIVCDWLLEVCQELSCQPEVFCMAVNYMDRFLSECRISKSQLQLLGAACLFLSSKFKAIDHISSDKLVMYTDYSITNGDLKDWELLVLHKLKWELSSTTPLDYLDHLIPRLSLPAHTINLHRLRLKTETVIALAATHTQFANCYPSLLAAASILTALTSACQELEEADDKRRRQGDVGCRRTLENILRCGSESPLQDEGTTQMAAENVPVTTMTDKLIREVTLCLQILTHVGCDELELCCAQLRDCLPAYLSGAEGHNRRLHRLRAAAALAQQQTVPMDHRHQALTLSPDTTTGVGFRYHYQSGLSTPPSKMSSVPPMFRSTPLVGRGQSEADGSSPHLAATSSSVTAEPVLLSAITTVGQHLTPSTVVGHTTCYAGGLSGVSHSATHHLAASSHQSDIQEAALLQSVCIRSSSESDDSDSQMLPLQPESMGSRKDALAVCPSTSSSSTLPTSSSILVT